MIYRKGSPKVRTTRYTSKNRGPVKVSVNVINNTYSRSFVLTRRRGFVCHVNSIVTSTKKTAGGRDVSEYCGGTVGREKRHVQDYRLPNPAIRSLGFKHSRCFVL